MEYGFCLDADCEVNRLGIQMKNLFLLAGIVIGIVTNLFKKLISCMGSKGYHQVLPSQCGGYKKEDNEVCMYP